MLTLSMTLHAAQQGMFQSGVVHVQARIRAAALWQGGTYAAEVYEAATADDQATLQAVLVQRLQSGLRDFCQKAEAEEEAEEEPDRVSTKCQALQQQVMFSAMQGNDRRVNWSGIS